ncbi:hypothetical protein ASAP_3166 [Asaia bogorensis]|uniref:Uncharacterized protein n=1 Tax=Asaia bogorensis TaxID=91915 RepID=A0A060QM12_9PROT|nr:hypothetical protein ASAP_3166 [Asaia bogorensis]
MQQAAPEQGPDRSREAPCLLHGAEEAGDAWVPDRAASRRYP